MVYFCGVLGDCNRNEYDRCVRIADPLVKEAHLVFPDNMRDIEMVCQNWNKFVDCIRKYTDKCFNDQQRRQFNKAVENPIESVHQMCSQPHYQSGKLIISKYYFFYSHFLNHAQSTSVMLLALKAQ